MTALLDLINGYKTYAAAILMIVTGLGSILSKHYSEGLAEILQALFKPVKAEPATGLCFTSVRDGKWSDPGTWGTEWKYFYPSDRCIVEIRHQVDLDINLFQSTLVIERAGRINMVPGAVVMNCFVSTHRDSPGNEFRVNRNNMIICNVFTLHG